MNTRAGTSKHLVWFVALLCLSGTTISIAQEIGQIQKCQDQTGQWHYGSHLNKDCRSVISDLNSNGIIINQSDPFKPASNLQVLALKQQQLSDQRLLRGYSSVKSIEQEKHRKLDELKMQQSINLELIEKIAAETQELKTLNSQAAQSAFKDRLSSINQYLNRHESLSMKIRKTSSDYDLLISNYLQALARSKNQTAALNTR